MPYPSPAHAMHFRPLPSVLKPLADKFYRQQRSPMRASAGAQLWVAQDSEIVAALNLNPLAEGFWLTALLVAPSHRGQGLGSALVTQALAGQSLPVWLFCQPALCGFYQRLGFDAAPELPQALAQRLARYQLTKDLRAMEKLPELST